MEELIVLDYNKGEVLIYTLLKMNMLDEEIEDYIDSMDFNVSDCEWMINKHGITINDQRNNVFYY